ncbi:MAG: hypothetical protein WA741_04770 [Candidatus Sulfotelmatobacter sp.]
MRKVILLLGLLFVGVVSLAQSYKYGEMMKWDAETRPYHGVTQKIVVYQIKNSMTTYTVTQGTTKPSELASRKLVEFRIDKNNRWVMYIKDKSGKEVKYSVILIGSSAR